MTAAIITGGPFLFNKVPVTGRIIFTPAVTGVYTAEGIQVQRRYIFELAADGTFTTGSDGIPATDSGNPTGWTYIVTEDFRGGRTYYVNAPTGTWNITQLAPVPTAEGGTPVVVGPQGPPGNAAGAIPFHFATPASTWTLGHNLGTFPNVVLFADDDPTEPTYTSLSYPDPNTVVVTWPSPTSGWAYVT